MKNLTIRLILLSILVLIRISSFSQGLYPQKTIINGDTVIIISQFQIKEANTKMLIGERNIVVIDNLRSKILTANELLVNRSNNDRLQELKYNKLEQKFMSFELLCDHEKAVALKVKRRARRNSLLIGSGLGLLLGALLAR